MVVTRWKDSNQSSGPQQAGPRPGAPPPPGVPDDPSAQGRNIHARAHAAARRPRPGQRLENAAIGVAAHEVGHAVQHATGYAPLQIRNAVVPLLSLSSSAAMPLFFIGLLSASNMLMNIGILLFVGVLAFHLITLPVEFDASNRALKVLSSNGMMTRDEVGGARKVLNAAAMTYVSATLMAALQLVRLLALRNSRNRD